jgi:Cu-processing system ATP-binding protein
VISFRRFSKRYATLAAVDSLDLEVGAGEVVALLGPNGSGKTTSLKAAAGLIAPTSGEVRLAGRPAGEPSAREVLSFLPQRVSFPDVLSGREVLEFYRSLRGVASSRVDAVLKFAALNGSGARAVGQYSGGMVQRLGLAVAMLPDTPVLLLDEPTAALDPDGLCAFYGLVGHRRGEGKTVFFTSHHLGDVERLADRFAVLVGGRLVATLTSRELQDRLAERGVMRLRFGARPAGLLEKVRAIAPQALWTTGDPHAELIVPGGASLRPAVLDVVRNAGAEVRGLTAEEGRLDTLYQELVADAGAPR